MDWGLDKNLQIYGQVTPPDYDLTKIKFPMVLFTGDKDRQATPKDTVWLKQQLGSNVVYHHN